MEGLVVLDAILEKLDARDVVMVACVSTRLRSCAFDDSLWRRFCARDFGVSSPVAPNGRPCFSFKATYELWNESFGMYPLPLVKRAKQCWEGISSWLATNFPEAKDTLRRGASEAELKQVEGTLQLKLPMAMRLLYRFCDGQETVPRDTSEHRRLAPLGIIGGYEFYDHMVNVHLLPLDRVVVETREFEAALGTVKSKRIIVAASYYAEKWFFLNSVDGQLYVGSRNVSINGEAFPCVPHTLIRPRIDASCDVPQDAFLLWLEEYSSRLHSGMIRIRKFRKARVISLFPEEPPACSEAITNGVKVQASAVLVPEVSSATGEYCYAYSIRMSLQPEGCLLDGMYYKSCQLYSRHWIIKSKDVVVADVNGEGVIGKYPLLLPNGEEFVYESCTPLPAPPGFVDGSFTFVPGRLQKPEGRQFKVQVARFHLEVPEYIF